MSVRYTYVIHSCHCLRDTYVIHSHNKVVHSEKILDMPLRTVKDSSHSFSHLIND